MGTKVVAPPPPDNSDMIRWMAERDDRNNALYAERQDQIMKMERERLELERASTLSTQRAEADLLLQAQELETASQEEALAQTVYEDTDTDNIITGFYGSLYTGEIPE